MKYIFVLLINGQCIHFLFDKQITSNIFLRNVSRFAKIGKEACADLKIKRDFDRPPLIPAVSRSPWELSVSTQSRNQHIIPDAISDRNTLNKIARFIFHCINFFFFSLSVIRIYFYEPSVFFFF
ncbi:hypothetical protein PUN28_013270 [Cardiocondyla obscurior]|uniref:Uncharacterized protein n=1 Tax=Cardiocondyla obscurior TaxID=286306 RepID=A0AAW2FAQ8_9HYME